MGLAAAGAQTCPTARPGVSRTRRCPRCSTRSPPSAAAERWRRLLGPRGVRSGSARDVVLADARSATWATTSCPPGPARRCASSCWRRVRGASPREVLGTIVAERVLDAAVLGGAVPGVCWRPASTCPSAAAAAAAAGGRRPCGSSPSRARGRRRSPLRRGSAAARPADRRGGDASNARLRGRQAASGCSSLSVVDLVARGGRLPARSDAVGIGLVRSEALSVMVFANLAALIPAGPGYVGNLRRRGAPGGPRARRLARRRGRRTCSCCVSCCSSRSRWSASASTSGSTRAGSAWRYAAHARQRPEPLRHEAGHRDLRGRGRRAAPRGRVAARLRARSTAVGWRPARWSCCWLVSALLRTPRSRARFWIDEGLSVGIASHSAHRHPAGCCARTARRRSTTCCCTSGCGLRQRRGRDPRAVAAVRAADDPGRAAGPGGACSAGARA